MNGQRSSSQRAIQVLSSSRFHRRSRGRQRVAGGALVAIALAVLGLSLAGALMPWVGIPVAVALVVFGISPWVYGGPDVTRSLMAQTARGGVVFAPWRGGIIWTLLAAGIALSGSLFLVWLAPHTWNAMDAFARGRAGAVMVAGIVLTLFALASARRPAGLTLTPDRLRGVRGGPRVDLGWGDFTDVSVPAASGGRYVVLTRNGRQVARIHDGALGSDPYAVAAIIDYYLRHPGERSRLADGIPAVEHVATSARQG